MTTMTETTTTVTTDAASLLKAMSNVALFASTDDTLPFICCLHLTANGGTLTVEATDRYVAAQQTVPAAGELDTLVNAKATVTALKPLTVALKAANTRHLAGQPTITVTLDGEYARFTLTGHLAPDLSVTVATNDGTFPRMGHRFPDGDAYDGQCTGHIAFNPAHLAKLAKVTTDDRGTPARFTLGPPVKPALVHIGETFRALVMPIRIAA